MEPDLESDSDAECLPENLTFDEAINIVPAENGTPESRADDRRFLRMARLLQRMDEIDKECDSWVNRSQNSQSEIAIRVERTFQAYTGLLSDENYFPREPSLTQKTCLQARKEAAAQVIVARTLTCLKRASGRASVKLEVMRNLGRMGLTEEGARDAETIMRYLAIGVSNVADVIARSKRRHGERRDELRRVRLPVSRSKLQEFTSKQVAVGLQLKTLQDIQKLFDTNITAYSAYAAFIHWINRTRYSNISMPRLGQSFQHRCKEVQTQLHSSLSLLSYALMSCFNPQVDQPAPVIDLLGEIWMILNLNQNSIPEFEIVCGDYYVWGL